MGGLSKKMGEYERNSIFLIFSLNATDKKKKQPKHLYKGKKLVRSKW